ncbi:MAG: secondary thiamine-phosphate synthase enzyme YjbQ [Desulfobacterales bacterium]|nr:secondary thiamine-phosphate synthase enzyme YjbQ [Desulfobacterales bacterium]
MKSITIEVSSRQKTELIDITSEVQQLLDGAGFDNGICMVYVPHTTAAVTINESADPAVARDIIMVLNQVVPWKAGYQHMEDNSPAHVKASLVGESVNTAVAEGKLQLGTWQGIFFCEFDGPRRRRVRIHLING